MKMTKKLTCCAALMALIALGATQAFGGVAIFRAIMTSVRAALSWIPTSYDFGSHSQGTMVNYSSTRISNGGNLATGTLTFGNMTTSVYNVYSTSTAALNPGENRKVKIHAFNPTGVHTGHIHASATGISDAVLTLTSTGTTGYSDSFTYSNGNLETVSGGVWVTPSWGSNVAVISNRIGWTTDATRRTTYYANWAAGNDQCMSFTGTTVNINNTGPMVRMSTSSDSGYIWYVNGGHIYWRDGGTETKLFNGTTVTNGATYKLCAVGTTISAYKNGALVGSATDANITSGYPGIVLYQYANIDDAVMTTGP